MVQILFAGGPPDPTRTVLDAGCGTGAFIAGIARWCRQHDVPMPKTVGVELDTGRALKARRSLAHLNSVRVVRRDFLAPWTTSFDFVIGNPPYVPITALGQAERSQYRKRYQTASGRFDLYLLFFEEALRLLKPGGRLVFVTPEKYLYVRTGAPLRRVLGDLSVEEIQLIDEATFTGLTTYPAITSVVKKSPERPTRVALRDGSNRVVQLPADGSSWLPLIHGAESSNPTTVLEDVCLRISCGVATGADSIFVARSSDLSRSLRGFAFPTIAGREIRIDGGFSVSHSMLVPYAKNGELLKEARLGDLGAYLRIPAHRRRLLERTCVKRKPWYAFHENPPLADILRPKILCKDISSRPFFVVDTTGELVPRHSVYYIVPQDASKIHELCAHLNSAEVREWLNAHCQRAANGFLRLQSHVLKRIPVPAEFETVPGLAWGDSARSA